MIYLFFLFPVMKKTIFVHVSTQLTIHEILAFLQKEYASLFDDFYQMVHEPFVYEEVSMQRIALDEPIKEIHLESFMHLLVF